MQVHSHSCMIIANIINLETGEIVGVKERKLTLWSRIDPLLNKDRVFIIKD